MSDIDKFLTKLKKDKKLNRAARKVIQRKARELAKEQVPVDDIMGIVTGLAKTLTKKK